MEELNKILELIKDDKSKKEANAIFDNVKTKIKNLDDTINGLQFTKNEAISSRDKAKHRLQEVSKIFDAKDYLDLQNKIQKTKIKKSDDELDLKKIKQLEDEIDALNNSKKELEVNSRKSLLNAVLERDITRYVNKYKAREQATPYLIDEIKKNAIIEDNQIIFKNPDETPMRIDGKNANLEDIIKMKRDEAIKNKNDMFFKIDPEPSGASNPNIQAGINQNNVSNWDPDTDRDFIIGRD